MLKMYGRYVECTSKTDLEEREKERKGGEKREERDEEANPLKIPINLTLLEIGLFHRLHIALFARVL